MVEPVAEMLSPERLALANQFLKLFVFVLAGFVGFLVITRVPPLLHTPLMSATNAIAAISLVGSLVVAGRDYSQVPNGWICVMLGFVAVMGAQQNDFDSVLAFGAFFNVFVVLGAICAIMGFVRLTNPPR